MHRIHNCSAGEPSKISGNLFSFTGRFKNSSRVALFGRSDIQSHIWATMQSQILGLAPTVPLGIVDRLGIFEVCLPAVCHCDLLFSRKVSMNQICAVPLRTAGHRRIPQICVPPLCHWDSTCFSNVLNI